MTIETLTLTTILAIILLAWRHALKHARHAWTYLRWYERLLLILCLAPIPGPLDEIAGCWLIARGLKRRRGQPVSGATR